MTAYQPGDKVKIITNRGHQPHAFLPGTVVTLERPSRWLGNGKWSAVGPHPRQLGKHMTQLLDERDFVLETAAAVPAAVAPQTAMEEWSAVVAAQADAESERLPDPDPVAVLGEHWKLASDHDLERALGGLKFERAQRAKETADV